MKKRTLHGLTNLKLLANRITVDVLSASAMFSHAVKNKKPYHRNQNCRVGKLLAVRRMRSKQVNSILVEKTIAKNPPQSIAVQLELSMKNFV